MNSTTYNLSQEAELAAIKRALDGTIFDRVDDTLSVAIAVQASINNAAVEPGPIPEIITRTVELIRAAREVPV